MCEAIESCTKMQVSEMWHLRRGVGPGIPTNGPGMPGLGGLVLWVLPFGLGPGLGLFGGIPVLGPGLLSISPHERRDIPRLPMWDTTLFGEKSNVCHPLLTWAFPAPCSQFPLHWDWEDAGCSATSPCFRHNPPAAIPQEALGPLARQHNPAAPYTWPSSKDKCH